MPIAHEALKIAYNKCPPGCRLCEEACARVKGEAAIGLSRIKSIQPPQAGSHSVVTCIQCGQPACLEVCPTGAIGKDPKDGVVRIDESKCIGCSLCTLACPYRGIYYNGQTRKSFKCDLCDGAPKCVEACPHQVLTLVKNQPLLDLLRDDMMVHGTTACRGCPAELALRLTLRLLDKNTVLFGAAGCAISLMQGYGDKAQVPIPQYNGLLGNVAASMTGIHRYYRYLGRDVKLVAFVGDGATVDIGFQALSGAADRGENVVYICYDNEGYMNTGAQRSSSTPQVARTYTTPVGVARHGKEQAGKYLPLIMLFHRLPYVATATIAYPEDYIQKLRKALSVKDGLSYIHLYSPCPTGWGTYEDEGLDIARMAVETNYFPLWEADHGKVRLTHEVVAPRPIQEYTGPIGRYNHLTPEDIAMIQESVDCRYQLIKDLATSGIVCRPG